MSWIPSIFPVLSLQGSHFSSSLQGFPENVHRDKTMLRGTKPASKDASNVLTAQARAVGLWTWMSSAHLGRSALSDEAEVGVALGHQRQVGAHIEPAITERLAVLVAAAGLMLLLLCTQDPYTLRHT